MPRGAAGCTDPVPIHRRVPIVLPLHEWYRLTFNRGREVMQNKLAGVGSLRAVQARLWQWALLFLFASPLASTFVYASDDDETFIASWTAANKIASPFDAPPPTFSDVTLRQIVRVSVGGSRVRVWLTNEFGNAALHIGAATIAPRNTGAAINAAKLRQLKFNGAASIVIPAGARVLSDPVQLETGKFSELAISIHLPAAATSPTSPVSYHVRALQTSFVAVGNQVNAVDLPAATTTTAWYYLSGVDVQRSNRLPVIAAFGDSITDGDQMAAPNEPVDQNARYTDFLARELNTNNGGNGPTRAAVINLGISGNQVTQTFIGENAVGRFDTDVLTRTGVTHLVVLEGINDIGLPGLLTVIGIPTPSISSASIIAGLQQIAAQARAHDIVVIGGTLTPSGGSALPGYSGPDVEAKRQAVNQWIRTSRAFDAVVDFDRVLRDPSDATRIQAALTADGLHPNSEGYRLMAAELARLLRRRL